MNGNKIKIEVSGRHLHLSRKDLDNLFGHGYKLTVARHLSQPGEFAAKEIVSIKTEGGQIDNVRVLGPIRSKTQVEISMTDARKLKINPPIRISGDIEGSASATLIGPNGMVELKEGVIIAQRHLHANPDQAKEIGVRDGQSISIKTSGQRSITMHNIIVRVGDNYDLAIHIDTDEGNASMPDY